MWNFLAPGRSGATASGLLTELILGLQNLKGGLSGDPRVAANAYLLWVENAEPRLRDQFENGNVARDLHSERYWRIREISDTTPRPMPLILAEAEAQERRLRKIQDQVDHYSTRLYSSSGGHILLPDTNVLIHGMLFDQVEWHKVIGVQAVTLVMPLAVLDELDKTKDRDPTFGRRARSVLRALDKLTRDKNMLDPIPLRPRVTLQLLNEPRGHIRQRGQDDEIIRQAEYFARLNDERLVILTRDRGMRLRAHAASLDCRILPADLERIQETMS